MDMSIRRDRTESRATVHTLTVCRLLEAACLAMRGAALACRGSAYIPGLGALCVGSRSGVRSQALARFHESCRSTGHSCRWCDDLGRLATSRIYRAAHNALTMLATPDWADRCEVATRGWSFGGHKAGLDQSAVSVESPPA